MVSEFDNGVELHSSEAEPETIKQFFRQLMPGVEYDAISKKDLGLLQRIKKLKANSEISSLKWLINLMEGSQLPFQTKEFLFYELRPFITWKPGQKQLNQCFFHLSGKRIFFISY